MKYCPNQECPHFERTGNFSEYNDSISICADCGTKLQNEKPVIEQEYSEEEFLGEPIEFDPEAFDSPLVVVGTFTDSSLAYIAKAQIETAGIPAVLKDEGVVSMDWMISNAVGGVKLLVPSSRAEEAYALLNNETIVEPTKEEQKKYIGVEDICPKCGSSDFVVSKFKRRVKAFSMLIGIPFTFGKNAFICNNCNNKW